ncbi:MAG: hypothetical protein ABH828_01545 [archaeon]
MNEVKITYETLFDLLRREKAKEELQELDESFYMDVMIYLKGKQSLLDIKGSESELFGASESEKVRTQIMNVKKIIKELYERREKKIIQLAINKSKTDSDLINTTSLLENEKKFFAEVLKVLNSNRSDVLKKLLHFENQKIPVPVSKSNSKTESVVEQMEESEEPVIDEKVEDAEDNSSEEKDAYDIKVKVRFTGEVPKFVGKKLEIYGPYKKGDEAELPEIIANILLNKGRAEKL